MSQRLIWSSAALAASVFLSGCAGSGIKGIAQAGPASVMTVIDETDERYKAPGVGEVKITAETRTGNAPAKVVGHAVTGPDGRFTLKVDDKAAMKDQIWIIAEKQGFQTLRAPVYLPPEGRVLVVVLNGPRTK